MRMLRYLVIVMVSSGMLVVGATTGHSLSPRGSDGSCDVFESIRTDVQELESASAFDSKGYKAVGKAFKKAAKKAPSEIKSEMKKVAKFYLAVSKAGNEADAVDVYSDELQKYQADITALGTWLAENCAGAGGSASGGGGRGGTLTLAGETIDLDSSRCFLQSQNAAGQKILLTGQASGTNAAGDEVTVDFSRYDESSQFAGDDVSISVGDPFSGDATSYSGRYDTGTIERSGDTLSASDIEVQDEQLQGVPASFEINC